MATTSSSAGPRPVTARTRRRLDLLASLRPSGTGDPRGDVGDGARHARARLWANHGESWILIRRGLVMADEARHSPLRQLSSGRGAAVQVLLTALFVAQCRPTEAGQPTTLPLRVTSNAQDPAWASLVALPVLDSTDRFTDARTAREGRVAQLRGALRTLEEHGRIRRTRSDRRDMYAGFRLLHEAAANHASDVTAYTVPTPAEDLIFVPASFFLKGWVDVLVPNETLSLLFLLYWAARDPDHAEHQHGMTMPRHRWKQAFGDGRGYEAYRELEAFGLLDIRRDGRRQPDGTIPGHSAGARAGTDPHRFRLNPDGFDQDALTVVTAELRRRVAEPS